MQTTNQTHLSEDLLELYTSGRVVEGIPPEAAAILAAGQYIADAIRETAAATQERLDGIAASLASIESLTGGC